MELVQRLEEAGWTVVRRDGPLQLPRGLSTRYRGLPAAYLAFLSQVERRRNSEDTAWFLCEPDYRGASDSDFKWNEVEEQSLEASEDNERLREHIVSFWNDHLPILLSVASGYAHLSIRVSTGEVVIGHEPEYEEVSVVCRSFEEFIVLLGAVLIDRTLHPELSSII